MKYIHSFKLQEMLPYIQILALPTRPIMIFCAREFSQGTPHFYADQELFKLGKKGITQTSQQNTKWLISSFKIISILMKQSTLIQQNNPENYLPEVMVGNGT